MNQERKLRPATPEEQAIHDRLLKAVEAISDLPTVHPRQFSALVQRIDETARRYGWAQGGHGVQLLIDENIVWQDIQERNPAPDILDNATDQEKRILHNLANKIIEKAKTIKPGP